MSDMIERVARAIYESGDKSVQETFPGRLVPDEPWASAKNHSIKSKLAFDQARAGIEAMREPTEAMCQAGEVALADAENLDSDVGLHETIPETLFKAMVLEALK